MKTFLKMVFGVVLLAFATFAAAQYGSYEYEKVDPYDFIERPTYGDRLQEQRLRNYNAEQQYLNHCEHSRWDAGSNVPC